MSTTIINPLSRILSLLKGYKELNGSKPGYYALCPAHNDSKASLTVWEDKTDGHVGLKCFAGCSRKAIVEAIGLTEKDLYFNNTHVSQSVSKQPVTLLDLAVDKMIHPNFLFTALNVTDGYRHTFKSGKSYPAIRIPYFTLDGSEYARFRVRTALKAKEGSFWNDSTEPLIPYGLHRLEDARKAGYLVIVEGESDCWTLWIHGIPALGLPGASIINALDAVYLANIEHVYVMQEPDNAGSQFPLNVYKHLQTSGYTGEIFPVNLQVMTGEKDPNDLHKRDPKTFKAQFNEVLTKASQDTYAILNMIGKKEEATYPLASVEEATYPELSEDAQLIECFLPKPPKNPKDDWFEQWNSEMLQEVSPCLYQYLCYSHQVSPEGYADFHISSALWMLSTIAARRIYVPLSDPVYTPLAIAFVARTSLFAKTTTARVALKVLKASGLNWLLGDDETTPQKLLFDMACHIPNNFEDMEENRKAEIEKRLGMSGQIGWYYDEFNQLIDAMKRPGPMQEFAGLLRKLDDCPDEYKYSTKSGGQEIIEKPYLPLLANTTPANLQKHAGKNNEFWNDGFWARFAFITPAPDAWKTETMSIGEVEIPETLTNALRNWNKRLGMPECHIEPILDNEGNKTGRLRVERNELPQHTVMIEKEAYLAYVRYRVALRTMIGESANQDLDGSYVRLSDKALRIAALIASLENSNRITIEIWTLAQEIAEMFRRNLHELYRQVSDASEENSLEDKLIIYMKGLEGKPVTARELLQYAPTEIRKLKTKGVEELLAGLIRSGIVLCKREGRKECFTLAS